MNSNTPNTGLVIGLAAFGLALAAAGVRLYGRSQARRASVPPEGGMEVDAGAAGGGPVAGEGLPDGPQAQEPGPSSAWQGDPPLKPFFLTVFAISIPLWLVGGNRLPIPVQLPVSSLIAFSPAVAASILTCRRSGARGVRELFKKAFDLKKNKKQNLVPAHPVLAAFDLFPVLPPPALDRRAGAGSG